MIDLLVVDDHPAVRAGVMALLRREPGIVPLAAAPGMQEALIHAQRSRPDVALVVAARAAGADGLMAKGAPPEEPFETIRSLASGSLSAPLATPKALGAASERLDAADPPILGMLIERVPRTDIAEILGLTATALDRRSRSIVARLATTLPRTR